MTQRMKQGFIVVLTTVVLIGSTIVWTFAEQIREPVTKQICLLYTSDAADD